MMPCPGVSTTTPFSSELPPESTAPGCVVMGDAIIEQANPNPD